MSSERRSDQDLVRAIGVELPEDVLSDDYPLDEVERELRESGTDPAEIGRWGNAIVRDLAKKRRLAWQGAAAKTRDMMQARLQARPAIGHLPRAELLARIEAARRDPRLSGPVLVAAQNLSDRASDEELRQVVEDIEALAVLADEGGDRGDRKP